jgi:hypothetical protein
MIEKFNINILIKKMKKTIKRLNLGDSREAPEGWLYVDYAIGARLAKIPIISFFLSKFNVFRNQRPKTCLFMI